MIKSYILVCSEQRQISCVSYNFQSRIATIIRGPGVILRNFVRGYLVSSTTIPALVRELEEQILKAINFVFVLCGDVMSHDINQRCLDNSAIQVGNNINNFEKQSKNSHHVSFLSLHPLILLAEIILIQSHQSTFRRYTHLSIL